MKITNLITTVLVSLLLLTAVRAETVYLTNVTASVTEHFPDVNGYHTQFELWDARGINSVTLQPFMFMYDVQGVNVLKPTDPISLVIRIGSTFASSEYWWGPGSSDATFSLPVETWASSDHPDERLETPSSVQLWTGSQGDQSPASYEHYLPLHPNEELTWVYGFDVLAYQTADVPEPSTWLLLAGGILAFSFYHQAFRRTRA